MLHSKFSVHRSTGSGGEDFEGFYHIYGRGCHVGHVTQIPRANFRSPIHVDPHTKFAFDLAEQFRRCLNNVNRRTDRRRRTTDERRSMDML